MTLSTDIYIHSPIEPANVFHKCRALIGATDEHTTFADRRAWGHDDDSVLMMGNDLGQGLPALLGVMYRPDGTPAQPEPEGHNEWCDSDCDYQHTPAYWVCVNLDTTYGYQDKYGGCGTLHARIVRALGQWLDTQGVEWSWRNEFTGDIHVGYDDLFELAR